MRSRPPPSRLRKCQWDVLEAHVDRDRLRDSRAHAQAIPGGSRAVATGDGAEHTDGNHDIGAAKSIASKSFHPRPARPRSPSWGPPRTAHPPGSSAGPLRSGWPPASPSALRCSPAPLRFSYPVIPRSEAAMTTTGIPLSIHVTGIPAMTSDWFFRRQQRPAQRSSGIHEVDRDRRCCSRHAVDPLRSAIFHFALRCLHHGLDDSARVEGADRDAGSHRPRALTSPRSMANGPTPARIFPQLGFVSTVALSMPTCANKKSMSTPGKIRPPYECHLTGEGMAAAEPIDLPRIGRSYDTQQDSIPLRHIGREIGSQEVGPFRRASTHPHAANSLIHRHASSLPREYSTRVVPLKSRRHTQSIRCVSDPLAPPSISYIHPPSTSSCSSAANVLTMLYCVGKSLPGALGEFGASLAHHPLRHLALPCRWR